MESQQEKRIRLQEELDVAWAALEISQKNFEAAKLSVAYATERRNEAWREPIVEAGP